MRIRTTIVQLPGMVLAAVTLAVLVMATGCGTTELTSLWKDPSYSAPPLQKLMVIAFRKNPVNRRMWEDAMVAAIGSPPSSTAAVPSYQLFPDDVPEPDAIRAAKDQQFDGVLVVSKVELNKVTKEVAGYTTSEPVTEYSHKWETYVTRYKDVYHAGYTDTSVAVSVRTDLLLTEREEGQLVWSATSKAVDPSSRDAFRATVAGTVAKELTKAHLIR